MKKFEENKEPAPWVSKVEIILDNDGNGCTVQEVVDLLPVFKSNVKKIKRFLMDDKRDACLGKSYAIAVGHMLTYTRVLCLALLRQESAKSDNRRMIHMLNAKVRILASIATHLGEMDDCVYEVADKTYLDTCRHCYKLALAEAASLIELLQASSAGEKK